ncbi:rsc30p [Saccharomyces arboricola H-6]|uniref:Rsc30p n=1 Tax=Saccharomyces arboricola (strain H-6 / AS 2.3317 / CBS 10644) TaxID=1160507 RepID=J8Q741_SACAR|nr:rsc30p [Saccharomyces arboricola H-6]
MMDMQVRKVRKPPACTQCRKRKIGCDRAKPICGNCVKYNKPDCFYPDGPGKMVAVPSASGMSTHGNGQSANHFNQGNGVNQKNVMIQTQYPIMQTSMETSSFAFSPAVDNTAQWSKPATYQNTSVNNNTAPLQNNSSLHNNVHSNTIVRSDSPDVPSMDQIREYNTRLQLVKAQNFDFADSSYPYNVGMNQDSAAFDLMTSPFTQEEVLLKETEFLKNKLVDLQNLQLKSLKERSNLSTSSATTNKIGKTGHDFKKGTVNNKRTEFDHPKSALSSSSQKYFAALTITDVQSLVQVKPLRDTPNFLFTKNFIILRDNYLFKFYNILHDICQINQFKVTPTINNDRQKFAENGKLQFPSKTAIIKALNSEFGVHLNIESLVPIFDKSHLLDFVNKSFPNTDSDSSFSIDNLSLSQLNKLGQLTVALLILSDSSTLFNKQATSFNALALMDNLKLIRSQIKLIDMKSYDQETIKFITMAKFYETLYIHDDHKTNLDEDLSCLLNFQIKDFELFHFLKKMYYLRHSLLGQASFMIAATENLSPIPSSIKTNEISLITTDLKLLETQVELINILQNIPFYLPVNLTEVECLLETLTAGVKKLLGFHGHDNGANKEWKDILNLVNTMAYTNFFLFVQNESSISATGQQSSNNDKTPSYEKCAKNLMNIVSAMHVFFSLSFSFIFPIKSIRLFSNGNTSFPSSGSEFLFTHQFVQILQNFIVITFAIFQRCEIILYDEFYKNLSNEEVNVQLLLIHDKILEILKKLEIIVSFLRNEMNTTADFKSIKSFNKALNLIKYMLRFSKKKQNFARNSNNNNTTDYSQPARNKNVLLEFPISELNRTYLKLKDISDFLMEREVFQKNTLIDKDLESDNLGITAANFNDFYDAFYN